jgi:hypothetical protein
MKTKPKMIYESGRRKMLSRSTCTYDHYTTIASCCWLRAPCSLPLIHRIRFPVSDTHTHTHTHTDITFRLFNHPYDFMNLTVEETIASVKAGVDGSRCVFIVSFRRFCQLNTLYTTKLNDISSLNLGFLSVRISRYYNCLVSE